MVREVLCNAMGFVLAVARVDGHPKMFMVKAPIGDPYAG